jgi:hypothetical protein
VEVFPAAIVSKREEEKLLLVVEPSDGIDAGAAELSASSKDILAMVVKELLSEPHS